MATSLPIRATGRVIKVSPQGVTEPVAFNLNGYGLAIGNDGMIYVATNYTSVGDAIVRVDPDSGEVTEVVDASAYPPRALAFNRDFTVLYFGTSNGGYVYRVDLDVNLNAIADPELLTIVPTGWHDTVEVDACGNVYVGTVFGSSIYRINADLSIDTILDWSFNDYGHGFEWGDPAGGWDEQSIYISHPYIGSRVDVVPIGVPGAAWYGEVLNAHTL